MRGALHVRPEASRPRSASERADIFRNPARRVLSGRRGSTGSARSLGSARSVGSSGSSSINGGSGGGSARPGLRTGRTLRPLSAKRPPRARPALLSVDGVGIAQVTPGDGSGSSRSLNNGDATARRALPRISTRDVGSFDAAHPDPLLRQPSRTTRVTLRDGLTGRSHPPRRR